METRKKMVNYRTRHHKTIKEMADRCKISEALMTMVEEGEVTHPKIVKRIARVYHITELESEQLMPINHRLHGGDYDPDRYKVMFKSLRNDTNRYNGLEGGCQNAYQT